jgi:osmotically-inducible protein OsmY
MNYTNEQVIAGVRNRLADDPRVPYPDEIAVESYNGAVALRGTVGSFAQRRAALDDARLTLGVYDVINELEVNLLNGERRHDAEIRGAALQRLIWDPEVPATNIDVEVTEGWVTLKGEVQFQYQNDAAFNRVARLRGVIGITNEIQVFEVVRPGRELA